MCNIGVVIIGIKDEEVISDWLELEPEPSDFSKVVDLLFNNDFKRRKAVLTNRRVPRITTLDTLAQLYDITWLKQWVTNYLEYSTSGDGGRARKDVVDISKFHYGKRTEFDSDMLAKIKTRGKD